ncbi:MAG: hypothetical protein IKB94_07020, partial [Clostridia bacterium]|nr:hypothetical protein [Clostridia bacterium]
LLDQCTGHGKHITADTVCEVAGMTGKDHLFSLADSAAENNSGKALETVNELHGNSCDMERLCSDLINHFRNLMIVKTVKSSGDILVCTADEARQYKEQSGKFTLENILYCISLLQESMANIKKGVSRRIEMEMAMIKICSPSLSSDNEALLRRISDLEHKLKTGTFVAGTPAEKVSEEKATPEAKQESPDTKAEAQTSLPAEEVPPQDESEGYIDWAEVLSELTKTNMPLWGVLTGSGAFIRGDHVIIVSDNPTLSAFIRTGTNARDVKEAVYRVTGKKYRLGLQGTNVATEAQEAPKAKKDPLSELIGRAKDMGINIDVNN